MRNVKDIVIVINNDTHRIFDNTDINYKSPAWERKVEEALREKTVSEVSIFEPIMTKADTVSLRNTLSARGIPYKTIIEEVVYRNYQPTVDFPKMKEFKVKRAK